MANKLVSPLSLPLVLVTVLALVTGCAPPPPTVTNSEPPATVTSSPSASAVTTGPDGRPFTMTEVARYDNGWAAAFLPDGRLLVTQRTGQLTVRDLGATTVTSVAGVPDAVVAGQGGLGDVALSPTFATDQTVYLSWVARSEGGTGAVVGRARFNDGEAPSLSGLEIIWRQQPTTGSGHFSHRLAFSPDGQFLFVTSGDRQAFSPAQDLSNNLGAVLRLTPDGAPAPGNPYADRGGQAAEIWSYGHRNPLGLAFDAAGNLWETEMGPSGGDEFNLIRPGLNYGWPLASNGSNYDGSDIPNHRPGDGFEGPLVGWTPSIAPGGLLIYSGSRFPTWTGDAFVPALAGKGLVRIDITGTTATLGEQWELGVRVREVEQGPDGSIYLLTDGADGQLLRLQPVG